jgi:hypothetical protein
VGDVSFINDRGEIAATGVLSNGDQHAILLVPCENMESDDGCKGDEDGANTAGKVIEASIARTP